MKDWLHRSALTGGFVWLALIAWPLHPILGIGTIEKLFLLAPLVFVPLGLALVLEGPADEDKGLKRRTERLQPVGAGLVVAAFFVPQGWEAGMLALPWLLFTAIWAWNGLGRMRRGGWRDPAELCFCAALLLLPVGAVGLVPSRWGLSPLGFCEPLVLLVAVHFHYAAFVAPIVAGTSMRGLRVQGRGWQWLIAILVSVGSPVLATGYLTDLREIRLAGALMLVLGLVGTSLLIARQIRSLQPPLARGLLLLAALSIWAAMAYAVVYAVADYYGEIRVAIPQMARTHGLINALGFSLGGLLGWSLVDAHNNEREII